MLFLVDLGKRYSFLQDFYPIGADIFVFVYPIFLTFRYLKGIIKKQFQAKQEALFIFLSCFIAIACNIITQQFFDKQRPIYEFGTRVLDQETILHSFLPVTSFPSDHAVVTFAIATATLLIASKNADKKLKIWSIFLFLFAIITGICRIGTTVHWTTDILAGMVVGILIPVLLMLPLPFSLLERWLVLPLIRLEERIIEKLFNWKQK